jgi:Restriction endonuclease
MVKMSAEDKAGVIIALRNYKCERKKKRSDGVDFSVIDSASDEKILMRSINPLTKAGSVGVDDVKRMLKDMKTQKCDRGVLISRQFTAAAAEEMALGKIQQVSDGYMPPTSPKNIYVTLNDHVNTLCKANCGDAPSSHSDCQSWEEDSECRVRTISNNASFHFERGWASLLNEDLRQLLSLPKNLKKAVTSVKQNIAAEV